MTRIAATALLALAAAWGNAQTGNWGDITIISGTLGNNSNRLCLGDGGNRVTDIGCPTYAPSVSTAGHVSITGNVSANKYIGDGSGLTNLNVQGDRIVSDTHAVIANQSTGYVSFTTGGSTWGYVSAGWSYLANLFTNTVSSSLVSTTNVSATYVDAARNGTVSGTYGYFRYISGTDIDGRFTGDGSGLTGVTAAASDRIISGTNATTRMVAISETGFINITQAGANSGWFDPYRGLVTLGVSATGPVSATAGYFSGKVGIGTDTPSATLQVSGSFAVSSTLTNTYPTFYAGTNGRVGINTMNPQTALHSFGTIMAEGAPIRISNTNTQHIRFEGGVGPSWRLISTINGATPGRLVMQYSGDGFVSDFTNGLIVYPSGTVSITSAVQIGQAASLTCDLNLAGTIRYFTGHVLQYCNGTAWTTLGAAGGGQEDRIVSGTTNVMTNQNASVTISTNGSQRVVVGSNGRVGVGTQAPAVALHVMGGIIAEGGIMRVSNSGTQQFRYENGTGLAWRTISTINGNTPGGLVVQYSSDDYTTDFVNAATFHVGGTVSFTNAIQVGSSALPCGSGISGAIRYGAGTMQYCNGTGWTSLSAAGSGLEDRIVSGTTNAIAWQDRSLTITTAGTQRMIVGENGRVGIGTSSPLLNLHVSSSTAGLIIDKASGNFGVLQYRTAGDLRWSLFTSNVAEGGSNSGSDLMFSRYNDAGSVTGTPFTVVRATGNVGISTTSPKAALDVAGTISASDAIQLGQNTITCATGVSGSIRYNTTSNTVQFCNGIGWVSLASGTTSGGTLTGTGSATAVAFWSGPSALTYSDGFYWNNTSKRLGIGTNLPDWPLHISTTFPVVKLDRAASGTSNGGIFWSEDGSERWKLVSYNGAFAQANLRNAVTLLQTADQNGSPVNQYRLTVNDSGNVGINTASQTATLQVSGTFTVSTSAQTTSASLYVGADGLVGIGTSNPTLVTNDYSGLHINAPISTEIRLTNTSTGATANDGLSIQVTSAGRNAWIWQREEASIIFGTSSTERIRLNKAGNLGISTSSPNARLDVNGTISASDAIQVGRSSLACTSGISGSIRYSQISSTMEYCNSTAWVSMGPSDTTPISFSVHKDGTNQTVTAGVATLITWSTEESDTNNNFASNTFSPTVRGKYLITLSAQCTSAGTACQSMIYKNGSLYKGGYIGSSGTHLNQVTAIVDMNGTTDSVQAWVINYGGTTIGGLASNTFFQGALLGPQTGGSGGATSLSGLSDVTLGTPANGEVLTFNGSAWVNSTGSSGDRIVSGTTNIIAYQDKSLTFTTANTQRMVIAENGRVGIGTNTPIASLHVSGTQTGILIGEDNNSGTLALIRNSPNVAGNMYVDGGWKYLANGYGATMSLRTNTSGDIGFWTAPYGTANTAATPVLRMVVSNTGNVGIGVGNPIAKLDVNGTISASNAVQIGTSTLTCSSGISGSIRYSAVSSTMEYCNSNAWMSLGPSATLPYSFSANKAGSAQTVAAGAYAKVVFDNEQYDTGNIYNNSNGTFTAPVSGRYLIAASLRWSANAAGDAIYTFIYRNSSSIYQQSTRPGGTTGISVPITAVVDATAGDVFEIYALNGGAGNGSIQNNPYTYFTASILGPQTGGGGGATSLSGLSDVTLGTPANGEVLTFNGLAWVNSVGSFGDRITSGTHTVAVNASSGYVSLSTSGTDWGYLGSGASYLPMLTANKVSATTISTSIIQVGNTGASCTSGISGSVRYSTVSSTMEYCNSTAWVSMGPSDTVVPAFSVHKNGSNQTVTASTWTLLTWSTEAFDSNNNFASNRFTPTIPGFYLFTGNVGCSSATNGCGVSLYKNGTRTVDGGYSLSGSSVTRTNLTAILWMNGMSDYVELWGYNGGSTSINGDSTATWFEGALLTNGGGAGGGTSALSGLLDVNTSGATTGSILSYNGTTWVVSSSAAAGVAALASLTDVTLTNLAGRDYLRYDTVSSKWVNISESVVMSTTTMVPGWPDAILCSASGKTLNLYAGSSPDTDGRFYYYEPGSNGSTNWIGFNTNGTYHSQATRDYTDCKSSIAAIYAAGRAFNFIGNANTNGDALGDRITSGTLAMVANSATSYVSLSTNGTDWGYLSGGLSYLPTLGATRVSSTNVSASVVQMRGTTVTAAGGAANYIVSGTARVSVSSAGVLTFATGGNVKLVVDSDGNIGVGASSTLPYGGGNQIVGGFGATATGGATNWNDASNARSGNGVSLLLGTATNGPGGSYYYHPFSFEYASKDGTGNMTQFAVAYGESTSAFTNGGLFMRSRYVGSWSGWYKFTTTAVSDYRAKEHVTPLAGGLDKVMALKPIHFDYKEGLGTTGPQDGFYAHELADIAPYAVTGKKDQVDDSGNPQYQSIDLARLTPLLASAVQQLKHDNDNQQAKIIRLEEAVQELRGAVDRLQHDLRESRQAKHK